VRHLSSSLHVKQESEHLRHIVPLLNDPEGQL